MVRLDVVQQEIPRLFEVELPSLEMKRARVPKLVLHGDNLVLVRTHLQEEEHTR
jgi:hypothetical protein